MAWCRPEVCQTRTSWVSDLRIIHGLFLEDTSFLRLNLIGSLTSRAPLLSSLVAARFTREQRKHAVSSRKTPSSVPSDGLGQVVWNAHVLLPA